jgi:hypothetical protein
MSRSTRKRTDLTDPHLNPNGHKPEDGLTEEQRQQIAQRETDFPLGVFSPQVTKFIVEAANAFTVDPASVAAFTLAILGGAIGASRIIEVKSDWKEYPTLWIGNILRSGDLKTPVLAACKQPLKDWQGEKYGTWREQKDNYERDFHNWQADPKNYPKPSKNPPLEQRLTDDATVESLADVLYWNPRGVTIIKDELTSWIRSQNEYKGGKGSDRPKYLSMWSSQSIFINRKDKDPVWIDNPFVSIVGGIQPDLLSEIQDKEDREDGLLARFLWVAPRHVTRHWVEDEISEKTKADYRDTILRLLTLATDDLFASQPVAATAPPKLKAKVATFTPDAKQVWIAEYNEHCLEADSPSLAIRLRAPYKKLAGHAAKFALILQVVKRVCGEADSESIDADSVYKAWQLIDYFKIQLAKAYGLLTITADDNQLDALREWLLKWSLEKSANDISFRMMTQYAPTAIRKRKVLLPLVITLIDQGEMEIIEEGLIQVALAENKKPLSNFDLLNSKLPTRLAIKARREV